MTTPITRRAFAAGAGASLFAALTSRKGFAAASQDQNVAVHALAEIGAINPNLHGSFAEHLGSCVYGGIWVGKNSSIPNINGFRRAAVDYMKALGVPVLRWPGGCFADDYHWRDGIGPVAKRPKTVNIHWGNYTEDNSFGTHEFIELCRLIGAEPYLAANVGSGTPEEMRDWVEYCNYPSGSTLSDERAANGSPQPFNVRYWGIGNENWGCGGNMTPEEYAGHFRRFRGYVRAFGEPGKEVRPYSIACGPNQNDVDWTRKFLATVAARGGPRAFPNGYAMHFYSNGRDPATKFTVEAMNQQLSSFANIEQAVIVQRGILDSYLAATPPQRPGMPQFRPPQCDLILDEWGVWDRIQDEDRKKYGSLWMQITQRSAVAAGMGLNVFHRQADKLVMCNIAQTVNVLHSILLAHENNCIRTSTYYAFQLQKPHRGNMAVRVETKDATPLGISMSASRKDNLMVVTFCNPKHDAHMKVNCSLVGAQPSSATAQLLYHPDFNACNTFEQPDAIVPKDHAVKVEGSRIVLDLPPISMATATVKLSA